MTTKVPLSELSDRMNRFRARMDAEHPRWQLAAIFSRVNQYYFTGTMQDGMLLVPRDGKPTLRLGLGPMAYYVSLNADGSFAPLQAKAEIVPLAASRCMTAPGAHI